MWSGLSDRIPRNAKNSGAVVAKNTSPFEVMSDNLGITMVCIRLPLITSRTSIELAVKAKMYGKAHTISHSKWF